MWTSPAQPTPTAWPAPTSTTWSTSPAWLAVWPPATLTAWLAVSRTPPYAPAAKMDITSIILMFASPAATTAATAICL